MKNNITITPFIIGVAGASASGKTSIAEYFAKELNAPIISQDWFYKELEDKSMGNSHNWDDPESFDKQEIISALAAWRVGKSVSVPRHDYSKYEKIYDYETIVTKPVMIFEGIFAFIDPEVCKMLDLKIFVECDMDTALRRRITRDMENRGYDLKDIFDRYEKYVKPAYKKWIKPTKKSADLIIYNNGQHQLKDHKGIDTICSSLKPKLYTN